MRKNDAEQKTRVLVSLVNDLFQIDATYHQDRRLVFSLSYRYDREKSTRLLNDRLKLAGYDFMLKENEETLTLDINPQPKFRIPRINIILFVVTLFTVYFVPVFLKKR